MNTPTDDHQGSAQMGEMLDRLGVNGPGMEDRRKAARLSRTRRGRTGDGDGGLVELLLELLSALPR